MFQLIQQKPITSLTSCFSQVLKKFQLNQHKRIAFSSGSGFGLRRRRFQLNQLKSNGSIYFQQRHLKEFYIQAVLKDTDQSIMNNHSCCEATIVLYLATYCDVNKRSLETVFYHFKGFLGVNLGLITL